MRLATRLFWVTTLMGLAVVVVALGIAYRADRNRERAVLMADLETSVERLASIVLVTRATGIDLGSQRYVSLLAREHPTICCAYVASPLGRFRIHTHDWLVGRPVSEGLLHKGNQLMTRQVDRWGVGVEYIPRVIDDHLRRRAWAFLRRAGGLAAAACAVWAGLAWLVGRDIARRFEAITAAARKVSGGELSTRVPLEGRDELADLARDFNRMAGALQEAEQRRHDFLAGVTHEMRSPLTAAISTLELMREQGAGAPLAEQAESVARAQGALRRLQRFVDDLLTVASLAGDRLALQKESVDLVPVLEEIVDQRRSEATLSGITLNLDVNGDIPKVLADRDRLGQAVDNLVGNALKFTPAGGQVRVRAVHDPPAGVRISVSDTGPGMSPEFAPKAFEPFSQDPAAQTRVRGRKGVGLGLAMVKGIAEQHGGTISAETAPEGGAAFHLTLPAA